MGYEIFDDIICITLEGNTERQQSAIEVFKKLNIPVKFFIAKRNPRGGRVGCFESHIQVIQDCYNNDKKRVLIFEDDLIPTIAYNASLLNKATNFMKNNNNWEVFQFGYSFRLDQFTNLFKFLFSKCVEPNIYNFIGLTTHAYCISRLGMEKVLKYGPNILERDAKEIPQIDMFYMSIFSQENCYCIVPMIFDQKWCMSSDNEPFNLFERILRTGQCLAETTNLLYISSLILLYRIYILSILILIAIYIIYKEH
jgi:GR25 family glycosyltransferase involved in LPS biosynthesis